MTELLTAIGLFIAQNVFICILFVITFLITILVLLWIGTALEKLVEFIEFVVERMK